MGRSNLNFSEPVQVKHSPADSGDKNKKKYVAELTDNEFADLSALIHQRFGIYLAPAKRDLVPRRLRKRLLQLGFNNYSQYIKYVQANWDSECENLANAITTNLTSFFREQHHFQFIDKEFLPQMLQQKKLDRRLRIWSAACSTGEEPYSLAMILNGHRTNFNGFDVKILATDLDTNVLQKAARGEYMAQQLKNIEPEYRQYFNLLGKDRYQVSSTLRAMIAFRKLNFFDQWPMSGKFELILCRNALIYFDLQTQQQLVEKFSRFQNAGDYLIVGHSESLEQVTGQYELVGKTIYRKC